MESGTDEKQELVMMKMMILILIPIPILMMILIQTLIQIPILMMIAICNFGRDALAISEHAPLCTRYGLGSEPLCTRRGPLWSMTR